MNYFLAIQNTYDQVELGLFSFDLKLLAQCAIAKHDASKELIPVLAQFLQKQGIRLTELPFIAVNQGPGPFTTLRVVISTVNGLSFATGIPLVGVDALEAARRAWHDATYPMTVIMFNAFAFDVYTIIEKQGTVIFKGYKNIDQFLETLQKEKGPIRLMGNGATLYRDKITLALNNIIIPKPNPDYCPLMYIAQLGYKQWQQSKKGVQQLLPLYLKQHSAQIESRS